MVYLSPGKIVPSMGFDKNLGTIISVLLDILVLTFVIYIDYTKTFPQERYVLRLLLSPQEVRSASNILKGNRVV